MENRTALFPSTVIVLALGHSAAQRRRRHGRALPGLSRRRAGHRHRKDGPGHVRGFGFDINDRSEIADRTVMGERNTAREQDSSRGICRSVPRPRTDNDAKTDENRGGKTSSPKLLCHALVRR